ncbi:hypothetical protein AK830_g8234 [Neonectria ditissima]|uniref:HMA domain-containing protein n=1 Tax=Neonectria ditissima TaxID=78410 RepID=A0A0N8H695_9HYPO|nr:hypothetical protein AK830_g8234 [Neonectria ditissima]
MTLPKNNPTRRGAKRVAAAPSHTERKRAQNRISQQCLREKNLAYTRHLESVVQAVKSVNEAGESDRYSVLLEAHLKLVEENRVLKEALLNMRKKLLSLSNAATDAAEDDSIFSTILNTEDADAENPDKSDDDSSPGPAKQCFDAANQLDGAKNLPTLSETQKSRLNSIYGDYTTKRQGDFLTDTLANVSEGACQLQAGVDLNSFLLQEPTMEDADFVMNMQFAPSPQSSLWTHGKLVITSSRVFGEKVLEACRKYLARADASKMLDLTPGDRAEKVARAATRFISECLGLEVFIYGLDAAKYIEKVLHWRLCEGNRDIVPAPFRPTPLQSRNPEHFIGIDLFNWPEIRDQLLLEEHNVDLESLTQDLILNSVIDHPQSGVAVNVFDVFQNQILTRGSLSQLESQYNQCYLFDPAWVFFEVDAATQLSHASTGDIIEEVMIEQLARRVDAMETEAQDKETKFFFSTGQESQRNEIARFLGLDNVSEWKLSKDFARKYPFLDCSSAAFIVFKFISLHERLSSPFGRRTTPAKATARVVPVRAEYETKACILTLKGLSCTACVSPIQKALGEAPGVSRASVSFPLLRAYVTFDAKQTSTHEMVEIVSNCGFEASLANNENLDSWEVVRNVVNQAQNHREREVEFWKRSFTSSIAASFTAVLVPHLEGLVANLVTERTARVVQILSVLVSCFSGRRIHAESVRGLWRGGRPNMSTLASLGMMLGFLQIGAAISAGDGHMPLSGICMVTSMVVGGRLLKAVLFRDLVGRVGPLTKLMPKRANILRNTGETEECVLSEMITIGDDLVVRAGEHVPADSVIKVTKQAHISDAWMTGSLRTRNVQIGEMVYAGSLVSQGELVLTARACGYATRLSKTVESILTTKDEETKSRTERFGDHFSLWIILLAALNMASRIFISNDTWVALLGRASSILLAACPCALNISLPASALITSETASKSGIRLATTVSRLESCAETQTVLFDKTGTLTTGNLQATHVSMEKKWKDSVPRRLMLWRAIEALERDVRHPAAQAIVDESRRQLASLEVDHDKNPVSSLEVSAIRLETGRGIQGMVCFPNHDSELLRLSIGSRTFMERLGVKVDFTAVPVEHRSAIATTVVIAVDGCQVGIVVCTDSIRPSALKTISELKRRNISVGMMTGDGYSSAWVVAQKLHIPVDMVFANCLPTDKANLVQRFQQKGRVMAIGDHLNDLPSLATASFSVCIGSNLDASEVGTEAADAILLPMENANPDSTADPIALDRLLHLINLSSKTAHIVMQNLWWAVGYNTFSLLWTSGALQLFGSEVLVSP